MVAAEQTVLRLCEHASRCWDGSAPGVVSAVLVAKHVAAVQATAVAASAAQVLASAGARDGHPVSRAHRDARLMEVIEGSTEICQLQLADIAVQQWS
jgi:methoxymalonate biosynthesis protein